MVCYYNIQANFGILLFMQDHNAVPGKLSELKEDN